MRIAASHKTTPLLPDGVLDRLHVREAPPVRLPFTRSVASAWLSTIPVQVARFFEPEGVLPISATRRGTGTYHERRWLLVLRGEVTNLFAPSPFAVLLRGRLGLTSLREGTASEETGLPRGPDSGQVKVRAVVWAGESPSRAEYRAPLSSCERCFERWTLSCSAPAPDDALRCEAGRANVQASASRIVPRRAVRSNGNRGAFHRRALERDRGLLPGSSEWNAFPRSTCAPKNTDALQEGVPAPLLLRRDARHDAPSTDRSSIRAEREDGC